MGHKAMGGTVRSHPPHSHAFPPRCYNTIRKYFQTHLHHVIVGNGNELGSATQEPFSGGSLDSNLCIYRPEKGESSTHSNEKQRYDPH